MSIHSAFMNATHLAGRLLACLALVLALAPVGMSTSLDTVTVVATAPTASEVGLVPGVFTFTRSGTSGALTVLYTVTGSAIAGTRYAALTGSVVIPNLSQTAVVLVTPLAESTAEGGQNVKVDITADPTYIVGNPFSAEVIIADKDLTAKVAIGRLVASKPGVPSGPAAFVPDPHNSVVFRVDFSGATADRVGRVHFDGAAIPGTDYTLRYMLGHDVATSTGSLMDIGRRSITGSLVNGVTTFSTTDPSLVGYGAGTTNISLVRGQSLGTLPGRYAVGDYIQFMGDTTHTYLITVASVPAAPGTFSDIQTLTISPGLAGQLLNGTPVVTSLSQTVTASTPRVSFYLPATSAALPGVVYNHVEYEILPAVNSLVTGAKTVVMTLESSPDFAIANPTAGTGYIAENNVLLDISLNNNAVRGGTAGQVTVRSTSIFPIAVVVPFTATGSAIAGTDYTFPNMQVIGTSAYGTVILPAGQTSVSIPVTALVTGATGIQTVTFTLLGSIDYSLQGSGSSILNPSATVNIADPTTPILIVPGTATGGTTGAPATVRPLPTSSSGNSCGLGSGLALVMVALAGLIGLRRRAD